MVRRTVMVLACSAAACSGETNGPLTEVQVMEGDQSRLQRWYQRLSFVRADALTLAASDTPTLTLVATVTPPVVSGTPLQATSVEVNGSLAYISYAVGGEAQSGAVDVVDLTNPTSATLTSQALFTLSDVNDVVVDSGTVYLATASQDFPFAQTAAVETLAFLGGTLNNSSAVRTPLTSFVANRVALSGGSLFATSGSVGGLFELNPSTLAITNSVLATDARAIGVEGSLIAVHGGSQVFVYNSALALTGSYPLTSAGAIEARSDVFVAGAKAFATAGTNGVQILSTATGTVLQTLALSDPMAIGKDPALVVANALAWSGAWMFVAEGAGGISAFNSAGNLDADTSEVLSALTRYGAVQLPGIASANDIAFSGNLLVVAGGAQGTLLVEVANNAFTDVSTAANVDDQTMGDSRLAANLWGDFDNDGDLDLFAMGNQNPGVYLNNGAGAFGSPTVLGNMPRDASLCDLDNDGDLDIFAFSLNYLENDGTGAFTNQGAAGMFDANPIEQEEGMACFDQNLDGWADLLIFEGDPNVMLGVNQQMASLSLTQSDGTLIGFSSRNGSYAASADINDDGYLDVMFDDGQDGRLFRSNGDGTWTDLGDTLGTDITGNGMTNLAFGDYDNDNDLDLIVPQDANNRYPLLFRNDGGTFTEVGSTVGFDTYDDLQGVAWGDYDSDGDLDVYFGCDNCTNELYRNDGDGTFTRATSTVPGVNVAGKSISTVFVDYDNDGDVDISILQEDSTNVLLRNERNPSNFLLVRLIGRGAGGSNRAAIGVPVRMFAADGTTYLQRRDIGIQNGAGPEPGWAHFGGVVGDTTYVLKAAFASGTVTATVVPNNVSSTIGGNTVQKLLTITEP